MELLGFYNQQKEPPTHNVLICRPLVALIAARQATIWGGGKGEGEGVKKGKGKTGNAI
jgi:hypothetical protein